MIVKDKKTGEKKNVPDEYGLRLIEQGQATFAASAEEPAKKKGGKNAGDA